jgi:hypothetical protein
VPSEELFRESPILSCWRQSIFSVEPRQQHRYGCRDDFDMLAIELTESLLILRYQEFDDNR